MSVSSSTHFVCYALALSAANMTHVSGHSDDLGEAVGVVYRHMSIGSIGSAILDSYVELRGASPQIRVRSSRGTAWHDTEQELKEGTRDNSMHSN